MKSHMDTQKPQTDEAPSPGAKQHLLFVDALRGAACFWVLLHHSFASTPVPGGPLHLPLYLLVRFSDIGWLGVNLFLVLSGFCLFYPLAARAEPKQIRIDLTKFARRRAMRILPPYYAGLALFAAVAAIGYGRSTGHWNWLIAFRGAHDLLTHLLMLHNLRPDTFGSVSPAFWSLALECQLYVIFPLVVWLTARAGIKQALVVTLLIAIAWQSMCYFRLGLSMGWTSDYGVLYDALPGRCFEFAAGIAAALLVARPRLGQSQKALVVWLLALVPGLLAVLFVSRFGPLIDQIWAVVFASILVWLASTSNARFERIALLRSIVWLGTISYSVYLVHQPLIAIISPHKMHLPATAVGTILAGFVRLPILVGIGYLFHLLFEKPFIRTGKTRVSRQSLAPASTS